MNLLEIKEKYLKFFYIKEVDFDNFGFKLPNNNKVFKEVLLLDSKDLIGVSSITGEKILIEKSYNLIKNELDLQKFIEDNKIKISKLKDEKQKQLYLSSLNKVNINISNYFKLFSEKKYSIFIKKGVENQKQWIKLYIPKIKKIKKILKKININLLFLEYLEKITPIDLFFTDVSMYDIDNMLNTILFKIKKLDIDFLNKIKDINNYIIILNSFLNIELSLNGTFFNIESKYEMEIANFLINEVGFILKNKGINNILLSEKILITELDFNLFIKKIGSLENIFYYSLEKQQIFIEADGIFENKIMYNIRREYDILEEGNAGELLELMNKRTKLIIEDIT